MPLAPLPGVPLVGNDVVDLSDPATTAAHLRPRFVARVCSADERVWVASADDPSEMLWSLFAAKEAAFKAVSKLRPGIAFAHRRFQVTADFDAVRYDDVIAQLWVWRDGDCIHAVATLGATNTETVHSVRQVEQGADLSAAARLLLQQSLAEHIGCEPNDLAVDRAPLPGSWTGFAPPELLHNGCRTGRDISLSHDGRFVAFAAVQ